MQLLRNDFPVFENDAGDPITHTPTLLRPETRRKQLSRTIARSHQTLVLDLAAVSLLSFALMLFFGTIDPDAPRFEGWDFHQYVRMAEHAPGLLNDGPEPHVYRVLGPYLAGILPMPVSWGFLGLSRMFGIAVACGLFLYLRRLYGRTPALLATFFYITNKYMFGFLSWDYYQVNDQLILIVVLFCLWSMETRRYILLMCGCLIGSLTREHSSLLLISGSLLLFQRGRLREDWYRLALSFVPALFLLIVLRTLLTPPDHGKGITVYFQMLSDAYSRYMTVTMWYRVLIVAFAPFSLLPLVFAREASAFFKRRADLLVFLVLVVLSTVFGLDVERLLAPAFVVFYSFLAHLLSRGLLGGKMGMAFLVVAAVATGMHHQISAFPTMITRTTTIIITNAGVVFVTGYALAAKNLLMRGVAGNRT